MSNKNNYHYIDNHVEKLIRVIVKVVKDLKRKFQVDSEYKRSYF